MFTFKISGAELLKHLNAKIEDQKQAATALDKENAEKDELSKKLYGESSCVPGTRENPFANALLITEFLKGKVQAEATYELGIIDAALFGLLPIRIPGLS